MLVLLRGGEDDDNFFERFVIFFFHRSRVHRALDLTQSHVLKIITLFISDCCSGLAVKKMIDCGAGVVDADCKCHTNN
jgi:hypothetical protein